MAKKSKNLIRKIIISNSKKFKTSRFGFSQNCPLKHKKTYRKHFKEGELIAFKNDIISNEPGYKRTILKAHTPVILLHANKKIMWITLPTGESQMLRYNEKRMYKATEIANLLFKRE
jgi:hypothetical protein